MTGPPATVEEYIASFPDDVQPILQEVRRRIRAVIPGASETISYRMPVVTLNGRHLVYFAGWKRHISLYPVPETGGALARELAPYLAGRSTARFPLSKPLPYDLIERLVTLLAQQRHSQPG